MISITHIGGAVEVLDVFFGIQTIDLRPVLEQGWLGKGPILRRKSISHNASKCKRGLNPELF